MLNVRFLRARHFPAALTEEDTRCASVTAQGSWRLYPPPPSRARSREMGFQRWPRVWLQSRAEVALDRAGLGGALCAPCSWLTRVCPGASGEQPPSGFYEPGLCTPFLPARETFTPTSRSPHSPSSPGPHHFQ